jgi:hypothetical protein
MSTMIFINACDICNKLFRNTFQLNVVFIKANGYNGVHLIILIVFSHNS